MARGAFTTFSVLAGQQPHCFTGNGHVTGAGRDVGAVDFDCVTRLDFHACTIEGAAGEGGQLFTAAFLIDFITHRGDELPGVGLAIVGVLGLLGLCGEVSAALGGTARLQTAGAADGNVAFGLELQLFGGSYFRAEDFQFICTVQAQVGLRDDVAGNDGGSV
ncbi:hypothetical protein D9M73_233690 [compost metagenome]